jgi:hypothetical protein
LRRCKRLLVEIYQVLRHDTQYIPTGLGYIQLTDAASTSRRRVRAIPEHHPSRPRRVAPAGWRTPSIPGLLFVPAPLPALYPGAQEQVHPQWSEAGDARGAAVAIHYPR